MWPIVRDVVRAADTFTYEPDLGPEEARSLWVVAPPGRTAVAVEDGRVLGTSHMGANRPGPGDHVATASFMVAAGARGRGLGRALVVDALDWSRRQGFAGMQFNAVAASNVGAVGLYESLGFAIVGTVPQAFRHPRLGRVGLHVMYCAF